MTLTVALAILGGLVLAAVVAQSAWKARQAAPKRVEVVPAAEEAQRIEPTIGSGAQATGGAGPVAADTAADDADVPLRAPPARRAARIDGLIDAIATLTLDAPVTGELAISHLPPSRRAGSKPFIIEGLNAESGDWETPSPGQRYSEFQAGVQMANRSGGLNEIEYSEFVQKIQAFAEPLGALVELPDMLEVVASARELDGFAGAHDAQLAVRLVSNSVAWSVGYIQQCALRQGFVPGSLPGRLVLPAAEVNAPPLLVLSFDAQAALAEDPNVSAVREATLSLDVPQSPESAEPFPAWQEAARQLANDMDATLVDDQGQPITLHAFAAIGTELQTLYKTLESRDLAAGSAVARRLFS
jgi:ZipA, C-terminal FtsZ-binding domain